MKKFITTIIICTLLGCSNDVPLSEESAIEDTIVVENTVELDTLTESTEELLDKVRMQQTSMSNEIHNKKLTIEDQLMLLSKQKREIEKKIQESKEAEKNAKREIENARREIKLSKQSYKDIEKEYDYMDSLYIELENQLEFIGHELDTAVITIAITVLQFGQEDMLYDTSTEIGWLVSHLPKEKIDSLVKFTPVLYSVKELKIRIRK